MKADSTALILIGYQNDYFANGDLGPNVIVSIDHNPWLDVWDHWLYQLWFRGWGVVYLRKTIKLLMRGGVRS